MLYRRRIRNVRIWKKAVMSHGTAPQCDDVVVSRVRLRDVDDQAASLAGWEQEYLQLSRGSYEGSVLSCDIGDVHFFVESSSQQLYQRGSAPKGSVALAVPLQIEEPGWSCGREINKDSMIVVGERGLDVRTPKALSIAALVVAAEELMRYATIFDCEAAVASALACGMVTLPAMLTKHLCEYLRTAAGSLNDDTAALSHANARGAFRKSLISGFVNAIGGLDPASQQAQRSAANHQRVVQRAVQYMRAHAGEPIGVVDVCKAVGVHSRVLQYCFNEAFGVTPAAYLRCLRLHQIRREIKESPHEPIGDIASRWGMWHLSRFASDYRALFGELPSSTQRGVQVPPLFTAAHTSAYSG